MDKDKQITQCGDVEFGKCEICHKQTYLQRTYYHYSIHCECHSPNHFDIVRHCATCIPKQPETTTVILKTDGFASLKSQSKTEQCHVIYSKVKEAWTPDKRSFEEAEGEPKDRFSRFAGTSLFPDKKPEAEGAEVDLQSIEKLQDKLYDFMRPFFGEVSDYCRRGHTLKGRKMDREQIFTLLSKIKRAIAERDYLSGRQSR